MTIRIRDAADSDAAAICTIYNPHVLGTTVTFEQQPVGVPEMATRIREVGAAHPWLVADSERGLLAYAYATRWRARAAYDHTVESTIYVHDNMSRAGVGTALYRALLEALRRRGVHVVVGCIALPNAASVAFHERCGFGKVAHFAEVGRKFGRWVDVGFWQLLL